MTTCLLLSTHITQDDDKRKREGEEWKKNDNIAMKCKLCMEEPKRRFSANDLQPR